jgi:beta-lactamase regulating signal transducer with metallopeptidase domain/Flp pilus assembly protein TadD
MTALFELAARLQTAEAFEGMLWMVAKATLILLIARLLLAAMPRASAATKHVVATAALIGVAAMPLVTVFGPAWEIAVKSDVVRPSIDEQPGQIGNAPGANDEPRTVGVADTIDEPIATAISVAQATGIADRPLSVIQRSTKVVRSTWKGMIVVFLGVAALLMVGHMAAGMFGVWMVVKGGRELTSDKMLRELDAARDALALGREVRLLVSSRVAVPVVWGIFRPVLLLPEDAEQWPVERLRVVLLHELAHLKRSDGVSLILTRLALSVFWFHPLAWSLERAGRSECERACDDLVLASGTKPSEYADHLLAIARAMPAFDPFRSVTLAMSRKTQLEGRLLSILQRDVARRVFSGRGVAIACALAVAVIIPVSAMRLVAGPDPKEAELAIKEEKTNTDSEVTVTPDVEAIGDFFLTKLGKYDKRADRFLREPRDGEDWYERAYDLYRNDRYAEAAVAFRKAADQDYKRDTALYNAACSYALLGDTNHALAELDSAIAAGWDDFDKIAEDSDFDPIRSDPRFARMLESRLNDVATRRVTETIQRYQALKDGKVVHRKSDGDLGDIIAEAISDGVAEGIHDGVKEAMHAGDGWFEVGLDLLRLRRFDESIHAFQKAIELDEKSSSAMYNVACAYSLKGDARGGMQWLEKAIEHGFGGGEKLQNDPDIALLRSQGGFDRLVKMAEDLEMRSDGWAKWTRGRAGWRDAMEHHRQVAQRYPQSGRAFFNLGYTALQARDLPAARDAFQRAIDLNYRVGTSSYNMACAYALQDNRDAAFEWLGKAGRAGFDVHGHASGDDDLDSLRDDPRWDSMELDRGHRREKRERSR